MRVEFVFLASPPVFPTVQAPPTGSRNTYQLERRICDVELHTCTDLDSKKMDC